MLCLAMLGPDFLIMVFQFISLMACKVNARYCIKLNLVPRDIGFKTVQTRG